MSIEEKSKVHPCKFCCREHCVNRGNGDIAAKNYSCYKKSKCADCVAYKVCNNPEKDRVERNIEEIEKIFNIAMCFVAPKSCKECYMACHCKNMGLEGVKFEMDLSKSSNPLCFSSYHSTK